MINRKTKDVGMPYEYNSKTYYIQHDLFRVNEFYVEDIDAKGNRFIKMILQNPIKEVTVSPFYDTNIEMEKGMILNVAYIEMEDGSIRVHGYEVSDNIEKNANLLALLDKPKMHLGATNEVDVSNYIARIKSYIDKIDDEDIKELVIYLYNTYNDKLTIWPAAVSVHHNYRHGLIQHLCNVARQAIVMATCYTDISMDLVIAGALLHDIGKLQEYTEDGKISDSGKYRDHISCGQLMIYEAYNKLGCKVDERDINRLLHIIISHHGKLEWGSPKTPVCKEAFIVHQADYIDTNMYILHDSYRRVSCGMSEYNKFFNTYVVNENIDITNSYDI